jgi:anti-sigma regulatory factor (Ser/Thr protein kinase)
MGPPVDQADARDIEVELTLRPTWSILPVVRNFVEQALGRSIDDPDLAYRLSMATHELFENAVKYAPAGGRATLRLSVDVGQRQAWIAISNQSEPGHLANLRQQFAEMARSTDPLLYYCEMMRRHSRQRDVSRLGLARIAAEGKMLLSLSVTDDLVTIRADSRALTGGDHS